MNSKRHMLLALSLALALIGSACASSADSDVDAAVGVDSAGGVGQAGTSDSATDSATDSTEASTDDDSATTTDATQTTDPSESTDATEGSGETSAGGVTGDQSGVVGDQSSLPELEEPPAWLVAAVPDVVVARATQKVTHRSTYEYGIDIETDEVQADACAAVTEQLVADFGFTVERDACAADGDSFLTSGETELRFIGVADSNRALLTVVEPAAVSVEEAVASAAPGGVSLPALDPLWVERVVNDLRVELRFVYDDDGTFVAFCETAVTDLTADGFETDDTCADGEAANLEREPYKIRISNTEDGSLPLVFYTVQVNREQYEEAVGSN